MASGFLICRNYAYLKLGVRDQDNTSEFSVLQLQIVIAELHRVGWLDAITISTSDTQNPNQFLLNPHTLNNPELK